MKLFGILTAVSLLTIPSVGATAPNDVDAPKVEQDSKKKAAEVRSEILILHATNDKKGIDPAIGKIAALEKPPFSAYDSYKLLERAELTLPQGETKERALPDGAKLDVSFLDLVKKNAPSDPDRYALSAAIRKADGKVSFPGVKVNASKGEYFFIAGQRYKEGILVIGIKVK